MKSTVAAIATLVFGLAGWSTVSAQDQNRVWHACVAMEIQERLLSQQRVRLSADKVTLEGDTLRLTGQASIRFDDTSVRAEEIVIDQSTKTVMFTTVRLVSIGASSRCAPPPSALPRIEFR
jgi:lipopolysaccharide assembly outer membrane protein LptD (OstA)